MQSVISTKASIEIAKLLKTIAECRAEAEKLRIDHAQQLKTCPPSMQMIAIKWYHKKIDSIYRREQNAENRLDVVRSSGVSSSERAAIARDAKSNAKWIEVERDRDLGSRGSTKVGRYAPLDEFFVVRFISYNGFMRNVKGCASLADTTDVVELKRIDAGEARRRLATRTTRSITGTEEKRELSTQEIDAAYASLIA